MVRLISRPVVWVFSGSSAISVVKLFPVAKSPPVTALTEATIAASLPIVNAPRYDTLYLRVKILYVSQYFPPEMGAPAARAAELAQHWSQAGHDVSVLAGFPNHPTGVVPPEWRARLRRLTYQEKVCGVDVFRTWLWPLPNRKSHERMIPPAVQYGP